MSRPPEVIRIKRKRDDDSPLTFLELDADGNKRARSTMNYLYKRRTPVPQSPLEAQPRALQTPPAIQTSAPDSEKQLIPSNKSPKTPKTPNAPIDRPVQRTFHISKADTERLKSYSSSSSLTGIKRRHNTVVFVERQTKMRVAGKGEVVGVDGGRRQSECDGEGSVDIPVPATPSTQQRRLVAIPVGRLGGSEKPKPEANMDRMAEDLSRWAHEVEGKSSDKPVKKPMTRFRPRPKVQSTPPPPAAAPETLAPAPAVTRGTAVKRGESPAAEDSDSEYVEEEYHIVDPRAIPSDVPRHMIGRLVIDLDEQEYFYEERNSQMVGYDSDDSDENAENHYANDYPDQELESDSDGEFAEMQRSGWASEMYGSQDFDEVALSDFGSEDWTQVREEDLDRDEDGDERDAKILDRIKRFNEAVNKHAGY